MGERRAERVAHLVQAELARLFLRGTNDPRLHGVTVTGVRMSPDLRVARVYVGVLEGSGERTEVLRALCLGEATKVARWLLLEDKAYEGTIRLGTATDTLDRTGAVVASAPVPRLEPPTLDRVTSRFAGRRQQVPPMYSALKRAGVP